MKPSAKQTGAKPSAASERPQASGTPAPDSTHSKSTKRAERSANGNGDSPYAESLLETFASIPRLKSFNSAIGAAGLTELLSGDGPLTIFAPTDRAFSKIPGDELAALLGDTARVADLIRHHVVSGRVKAPRAKMPRKVTPQFGEELELTATKKGYHVDDARIVKTNIRASNGVIHAIDTVLDPG